MAELSESDKRILLGDNYKSADDQRNPNGKLVLSPEARRARLAGFRSTGLMIGGLAAMIFVTNWLHISGPYEPRLAVLTGVIALAGGAVAWWAHSRAAAI